ncbi:pimeloyl-ACP methyl ester carboxylesterase [Hamadaea flava]|uniref:Alpha/beta fold hydrolase n=1 Tax=Hamadaea flava TaxID=1742688 RepID=A0ABV8M154_9ACTN|nr:alpha/beta hydrolase [Hamadaea flava]MCP2324431.1 pimeloyl-ACP methyl ester carboxylesterase [Hamadaea flava]
MGENLVAVNDVHLCVEELGDPADPSILLIGGASSSMDWWDAEFCRRLASGEVTGEVNGDATGEVNGDATRAKDGLGGRHVIRYDHRDTGRSTAYPVGEPGYGSRELLEDASALIERLAGGHAHVVGVSMGGGLAQDLVLRHPERVASLTLISTSPIARRDPAVPLPPMAARLSGVSLPDPDWSDRESVVEYYLAQEELYAGPSSFDTAHTREVAGRVFDRSTDLEASAKNHWIVITTDDEDDAPRDLGTVTAPTLVIHGDADPMFPVAHGVALTAEIPGATLLVLDGGGHQVPPPATWDVVVPAIRRHTCREMS